MPRRFNRSSPKPPAPPLKDTKATDMRLRGKPPPNIGPSNPVPEDLESAIIKNWKLPSSNINTCIPPELWPYNESDPKKWHIDIVYLLHKASTIDLEKKGKIVGSNNEHFRSSMGHEIQLRQLRNRSAAGKKSWMTATDLKKVIKHLHFMAENEEDNRAEEPEKVAQKRVEGEGTRITLRGGSNNATDTKYGPIDTNGIDTSQQEKVKRATRGRGRSKKKDLNQQDEVKPGTKRQASDLPIRPARKLRGVRSPKIKPAAPPPVTPANPPEPDDSNEEEDDQENEPPEPVSGRHIYGDFIKPTTIDFIAGADGEIPAQAKTRQTRKRGRADNEKPPTEEQIDSDPRDIDATGFLSELDPKEARRRRKPRLSRLQDHVVLEPAWSQDAPPPETPLLTPATDGPISGTPAAPVQGMNSSPSGGVNSEETTSLGIKMLLDLLPGIPDIATSEERSMLEDQVALIHKDIVAYKTSVMEINEKSKR
ncbi:uncharacterized protein M421DRAFT_264696 [Didymella exigua CBS 183.55]|uniref:Uncharacterized protein n=1 Tax=Didymella exigua CBS 183.55 TaxID=1150837 RepID=A0A6A5RA62_9PLEO|nr:uncharacterized protein M421DRAFT_264696 [Didymella exigua CBS 183.55]KAF1925091.1 hypothetical protein M421DRAFT_264696 [Didymella exigua CBS 183.55]